jgi:predicted DNA-binding transcriptional regulator AlpA
MHPEKPPRVLADGIAREPERRAITGVPTSSWYALQDQGLAPRPVPLGPRSVGWFRRELLDFCEQQRAKRDAGDPWRKLGDAAAKVIAKAKPMRRDRDT